MEVNMRLYIFLSHVGLACILIYSFMKYNEFYSAVVYLSTEKFPRTIIYNFFLMVFIIMCKLLLNIFIGELRYLEVEQLIDNARAFIMDTILFLVLSKPTINGKEVSSIVLIKYLCIIVILKAYHLVLYSRVSHIFELGIPRTRVLIKLFIFMCLLSVANLTIFKSFQRYRELTKNIENKFMNATEEELKEVGTCIICRDDLKEGSKKLSCSHIFHVECLKSWFIQQQTCPICRTEIKPQSSESSGQSSGQANAQNRQSDAEQNESKDEEKVNQLSIQEIITKASFLPNEDPLNLNDTCTVNDPSVKIENCAIFSQNVDTKDHIKILSDMCDYYRELCLSCLKEIDKINHSSVPANVMLRSIYGSMDYNILNKTEEDEVQKYLNKISHVPQMNIFKNYLEKILITDMKYTKDICSLM
ncbi:ERAD-associated E3 ubiquitin-protein ligase HRD1, putative [Plasmodium ovale wallikeri]|uniref:RING-type E3 ubiquitin transferase n=1 Tax=Plasmodium ovale wallikeri TaxID=864142 RepID=A0A1A8ZNU7_PLAOA|nr:ERAD-associated E3 ubiquitin-protein ligase HRD1, putative [Plasmodium ovale wallikeri]